MNGCPHCGTSGGYRFACPEPGCGKVFESAKQVGVHWTGSHSEQTPCAVCGELVQGRGLARHEARCRVEMSTVCMVMTADEVRARVIDFFQRVRELPSAEVDGSTVYMVPATGKPMVLRDSGLAALVAQGAYMFAPSTVSAGAILEAERLRERRLRRTTSKPMADDVKGLPGL